MLQALTLGYICDQQLLVWCSGYSIKNAGKPCWNRGLRLSFSLFIFLNPCHPVCPLYPLVHQRGDNTDLTPNTTLLAS